MSKKLKAAHADNRGFTASETVTIVAVLGAVAYLLLPLIFPGDSLTTEEKAEKDLTLISDIIEERKRISSLNDALESMTIGNLGVYASHGEVTFKVDIEPDTDEVNYCLIGLFDGTTYYADSYTTGISPTPVGYCIPEAEPNEEADPTDNEDGATAEGDSTLPSDEVQNEDGMIPFDG
jgi:hypothetical protein